MTRYRLYRLDGRRQIVGPPEYFEAIDDEHAVREAQRRLHPHLVEIWTAQRFVCLVAGGQAPPVVDPQQAACAHGAGD